MLLIVYKFQCTHQFCTKTKEQTAKPNYEQTKRVDHKTWASINRTASNQISIYDREDGAAGSEDDNECFSLLSSFTTAASASGLTPRSQRAIRTESVWRSKPVSSILDIWNARSRDSRAVRAASGSMLKT